MEAISTRGTRKLIIKGSMTRTITNKIKLITFLSFDNKPIPEQPLRERIMRVLDGRDGRLTVPEVCGVGDY